MSHDLHESDLDYDPAGDVVDVDTDDNDEYGSAEEHRALSHRAPSEHLTSSSTSQVDHHVTVTERPSVVRPSSPTRSATPPPHGASDVPSSGSVRPGISGSSGPARTRSSRVESLRVGNSRSNRLSDFFTSFRSKNMQPPLQKTSESRSPKLTSRSTDPPPPSQPPPSLDDLGLSLQAITPNLSPSHLGTPPTSGAFMRPNFLLLCHSQGLDILPLVGPPAPQAYALVRRVAFKTVVVMEERGVLVAIAGRREGVRVYALEDVRKAIEWRMEFEIQKQKERIQREEAKLRTSSGAVEVKGVLERPGIYSVTLSHATTRLSATRQWSVAVPTSPPPRYATVAASAAPEPVPSDSATSGDADASRPSVNRALSVASMVQQRMLSGSIKHRIGDEEKADWLTVEGSDEEALIAAGPSGSAALDERTSSMARQVDAVSRDQVQSPDPGDDGEEIEVGEPAEPHPPPPPDVASTGRRGRPSSLHLVPPLVPDAFPVQNTPATASSARPPTVFSLQRAMMRNGSTPLPSPTTPAVRSNDIVSLAEVLRESRLPGRAIPSAILQTSSHAVYDPQADGETDTPEAPPLPLSTTAPESTPERRRQRWSVVDALRSEPRTPSASVGAPRSPRHRSPSLLPNGSVSRSSAFPRSTISHHSPSVSDTLLRSTHSLPRNISNPGPITPVSTVPRRFLSKLIPTALKKGYNKRSAASDREATENVSSVPPQPSPSQAPAPKMEYVKLPGTKGALMIKAVETAKKSFLAILCGDQGEKVELFAGTYRTALGLSRTFILPDSPRSLELQLQGDDLVELFLVFSQNVFGLEPATVRVREVRVGRAERRAARRRAALENQSAEGLPNREGAGEGRDGLAAIRSETTNVVTSVVTAGNSEGPRPSGNQNSDTARSRSNGSETVPVTNSGGPSLIRSSIAPEELTAKAAAQLGDYSTFQQLPFAPQFPAASIVDEYIIPPTYPSYLNYREEWEKNYNDQTPEAVEEGPPQPPAPLAPHWYYKDPKGILRGPWDVDTMYNWLRDGFLPPDLPLRHDSETAFTTLKALQDSRPGVNNPFEPLETPPETSNIAGDSRPTSIQKTHPRIPLPEYLLPPISLLAQPRHFGPPALFFSSRGGHSTSIVDRRGRSVLKGRVLWNSDRSQDAQAHLTPLGDVKRLEAFDVKGTRAILVAIRQGGIEAVDMSDALLQPADLSRTSLPFFSSPNIVTGRRSNFVWRMGNPLEDVSSYFDPSPHGIAIKKDTVLPRKSATASRKIGPMKRSDAPKEHEDSPSPLSGDEIFSLGRWEDHVYLCERTADSFRILRISLLDT